MKRKLAEETVLFISIFKWFVLATIIGTIVGAAAMVFLKLLEGSISLAERHPLSFLLLPAAFLASVWLVRTFAPDAGGHGTEKVIEAVHKSSGRIRAAVVPVKLLATILTLAAGGSAGKEGPCAQIGAGLSSIFADLLKFDDRDRRKLVICGISAGFASVFGTPIAGALFGVEVLFVGGILYDVLLPSFIAGVTSYHVSSTLGITYFYHPLRFVPQFNEFFLVQICLAGVFFGLCALAFIELMKWGHGWSARLKWSPLLKAAAGGAALALLALATSTEYLGLGLTTIEECLRGRSVPWHAPYAKMLATTLTLGFGGSGGVVTPIFYIGSTAGSWLAGVLGIDRATLAAIGFVSVLAGAANTPIAASVMAIEVFGPQVAPYAAVSCVISFLMTGHRSIYPSQILSVRKSSSVDAAIGREMEAQNVSLLLRDKSWSGGLRSAFRFVKKAFFTSPRKR